ncbi:MAG: hypothetical protein MJE77_25445 [Proteobacteria bacterium]|nr:hypothetical protein [Pseudomonadota bacterium]
MRASAQRLIEADVDAIAPAVEWTCARLAGWVDHEMARPGLTEALTNALIHGSFGLDRSVRDDLDVYLAAIHSCSESGSHPPIELLIVGDNTTCRVQIRWNGAPCPVDHRHRPHDEPTPQRTSGRGMHVIYHTCSEVLWCDDGLEIHLIYRRS